MALYPPIIEYSMPAFAYTDKTVRIYFGISDLNSKADIKNVHITVKYQENNSNALNTSVYPSKIKFSGYNEVTPRDNPVIAATPYRYYVELSGSDLITGSFRRGVVYKVQIRFSTDTSIQENGFNADAAYFNSHLTQFSEWSTVCLIKGIARPILSLPDFNVEEISEDESALVTTSSEDATFAFLYTANESGEFLKKWRMRLFKQPYREGDEPIADSGEKKYSNYDFVPLESNGAIRIEHSFAYKMKSGSAYHLLIEAESKNGYIAKQHQAFTVAAYASDPFPGTVDLSIDEEEGYAMVKVRGADSQLVHLNVTLRRTSSKTNFRVWEDVANKTFSNHVLEWDFADFTIESGVYYQYGAQIRDGRGRRGILKTSTQEMGEFESAFLVERGESLGGALQLKMKYDFQISQMSTVIAENKTDTIGSQYPFVRRNGNMYYRTFQGTGLITAFMDEAHLFTSDAGMYYGFQEIANRHMEIRHRIEEFVNEYDYTKERNFRQLVEKFLYNNKVKLFKSLQEGNMLVKLMSVTLTPKQELGRLIYSFSATFVEIDEDSVLNYDKYGIQNIGRYNPNIVFGESRIGQLNSFEKPFYGGKNVLDLIKEKYSFGKTIDKVQVDDFFLSYLRMEIESEPYLIKKEGENLIPLNEDEPISADTELVLGWLFYVNDKTILVQRPNNIYELKGENVYIGSGWTIIPARDTKMTIDYLINISKSNSLKDVPVVKIYKNINTQVAKVFAPNNAENDVANILWYRYYLRYPTYYTNINAFFSAEIDAEPGVFAFVKTSASEEVMRVEVDETGLLFIESGRESVDDNSASIESLIFGGQKIDVRYIYAGGQAEFETKHKKNSKPHNPANYDFYSAAGKTYMFYKGDWREAKKNGGGESYDITIDADAIVNCYIQTVKGVY